MKRLALQKAQAIHALHPHATVIGADTTVVLNGEVLGKPTNTADAERMLRSLAGKRHQVHTGVAVVTETAALQHVETTDVLVSTIADADLAHYLATGDSLDKAGAYGIQGYAARWITRIEGDFFNVMGLPIAATDAAPRAGLNRRNHPSQQRRPLHQVLHLDMLVRRMRPGADGPPCRPGSAPRARP